MVEKKPEAGNKEPAMVPTVKVMVGPYVFIPQRSLWAGPALSAGPAVANRLRPHLTDVKSGGKKDLKLTELPRVGWGEHDVPGLV